MKSLENILNLTQSNALTSIFELIGFNYSVIDPKGNYIVQNNCATANITKGLLNAKDIDPITWSDCQIVMKNKEKSIKEEVFEGKLFLSIKQPLFDEDSCLGILVISYDVTIQRQAEIAKQEFLMNMAHDLRTPLAGIIGLASIQADQGTNAQEKQYGHWILGAGEQLLDLLNAVLKVIDTEQMIDSIQEEPIHLSLLAKELQALMQPSIEAKKLEFELKLDARLPTIISDQIKLKRLLLNLLSNAVKFTKEGKVSLEVDLLSIEKDQAKIEICVADTGIGIAKDKVDKIFDRFYRAHPSYQAEYTGYGVGLYLVKKTIELLGGKIKVSSQEGKGSSFSLEFIFPIYHEPIDKFIHPRIEQSMHSFGLEKIKGTVLVAEDNDLVLYAVKKILTKLGYEVIAVTEGKAALQALQTQSFVWALLDIGLPNLSGIEVAQHYRQWEKENNKPYLPLFALTAHAEDKIKKKCKEVGIDEVLHKPFTEKDTQIIKKFLDK